MAPHPVLLAANLFSGKTQLGLIVAKPPSKSKGEFVDRNFLFKWGGRHEGRQAKDKFQQLISCPELILLWYPEIYT